MRNGIQVQSQAPGSAHADLGFFLQSQIIGQPMAMTEAHLNMVIELITANRFVLPRNRSTAARITDRGTAIVEIHGVLLNRIPVMGSFWGLTAYEGIIEQCRRLETHADVKRVVLDIDSPGGLVTGLRQCSEAIKRLADKKPVYAVAHDMACSAGYWLASCADEISVTADAEVGSIGVRAGHVSFAEALERDGVHFKHFSAGATKTDGSPYKLLSEGDASERQYSIDRAYDRFVEHVASERGMTESDVRQTDARCFTADAAIEEGLADRIETLEELVERIESDASKVKRRRKATEPGSKAGMLPSERSPASLPDDDPSAGSLKKGVTMTRQITAEARDDLTAGITEAIRNGFASTRSEPAPAAAGAETQADNQAAAVSAAVEEERARIFGILECDEAKERSAMAVALAKSGMGLEAARDVLKASPATPAAGDGAGLASALHQEMKKKGNAGGVKPEAEAERASVPSLAQKFKTKFANKKGA